MFKKLFFIVLFLLSFVSSQYVYATCAGPAYDCGNIDFGVSEEYENQLLFEQWYKYTVKYNFPNLPDAQLFKSSAYILYVAAMNPVLSMFVLLLFLVLIILLYKIIKRIRKKKVIKDDKLIV